MVARTVAELAAFGLEPRHLRAFKAAADREVGLVEQVVTPLRRQRNPEARARAEEAARELAALSRAAARGAGAGRRCDVVGADRAIRQRAAVDVPDASRRC